MTTVAASHVPFAVRHPRSQCPRDVCLCARVLDPRARKASAPVGRAAVARPSQHPRGRVAVTHGAIAPSSTAEAETEPQIDDANTAGTSTAAAAATAKAAAAATATATATTTKFKVDRSVTTTATTTAMGSTTIKKKYRPKRVQEAERKQKLEMDSDFCRMRKRYDPEVIRKEAMAKPMALARRGATVSSKFLALYSKRASLQARDAKDGGSRYAAAFKDTLTSLGPLFVKLGQNLANRPDLVDEGLMEELTRLQDRVPPFPSDQAMRIIEEDAGRKVADIFSSITPEPVAAASIGQVYKATLKAGGQQVAVKILRPGTRPQVVLDLFILRAAAERFFDDFARKNLGCPATLLVDEFAEKLLEELDFQQEALNLRDFKRNFSDDPAVQIPGVFTNLSSPRVLVMEWQEGVRCTAEGAFESNEAKRIFLQNGVESGLRQLLDFGLFHGDPHPGNVLALPSGDIAYVDFGNVAEISRANQESLIDAVVHVMNRDYDNLAECLSDLGFLQPGSDVRPVAEGLAEVWGEGALAEIASAGNFSFRGLTREFNKLLFKYPIRVPERFSLVIRALLTQENICLTLDPSFNFLEAAFPYVARRLLTDPDPNLRLRLLKVVIVKGKFEWSRLRELVTMAEAGAAGGIKLPIKTAISLVSDTTKMLATDGSARSMLINGFKAVPLREHVTQAASLGAMILGLTVGKWWRGTKFGKAFRKARVSFVYSLRRAFAQKTESKLPSRSDWPMKRVGNDDSDADDSGGARSSSAGFGRMIPAAP